MINEYVNTMNDTINIDKKEDCFKKKFKYFKSNKVKHFNELLSIEDKYNTDKVINITPKIVEEDPRIELLGLKHLKQWKLYTFQNHPGLIFIRNPFTSLGQRYWIRKCLEEYPKKPNKMNIDIEMSIQDWWTECYESGQCNRVLQKKLRWTTLGYHHNWDTKIYSDENRTPFPEDLSELTDVVADYLSFKKFKAEAAIVNYYHMDSTLSAHTDHSEANLDAPLFSFSFGQSAIFLIGGQEKFIEPSAILLSSGDIVVMSKQARLCYHAVPKILPASSTPWNDQEDLMKVSGFVHNLKYILNKEQFVSNMNRNIDSMEWSTFEKYIEQARINMNVRQVLNEKQDSLTNSQFNDT